MGNILAIQQGQAHSHGDAVVCAQGSAFGVDQVPVHHQIQALTSHVLGAIRGHFTDHVHVTLEHHGGGVLIARGTGLAEDHIPQLILLHHKATIAAKLHQIIAEGLCVSAAVGNTAQLLKPMKYPTRLQAFQYCHNFSSFLFYFLQVLLFLLFYFPVRRRATYTPLAEAWDREWVMPLPSPITYSPLQQLSRFSSTATSIL